MPTVWAIRFMGIALIFLEDFSMNKIKNLSETNFMRLFYAFITACFLIGALCMPDRADMLDGLWRIITSPAKISTNYFALGGYAATFLNMGFVALISLLLFSQRGVVINAGSTLAFLLTTGFGSWGINVLNVWPSILGVVLYCVLKKDSPAKQANAMLYSTGIAPLISDLMLRYPGDAVGFTPVGVVISLGVGLVIGLCLPAGMTFSPKVHKGFDLYSAALPIGMMAFFLQAVLFKTMGVTLPSAPSADTLQVANSTIVNVFCLCVFCSCVIFALILGCRPKDYWELLKDPDQVTNFAARYGNATFLMNAGLFGLMILAYYNAIGATFNGITFGIIFCMLACCNSGSHPANVWPIMAGYLVFSYLFGWLSNLAGGNFAGQINAQAIMVGLCYANGLSPIADRYGWGYGMLASGMHYLLVTSVPALHGGFCLYNGGFTAALICLILVPQMEQFLHTKPERKLARAARKVAKNG